MTAVMLTPDRPPPKDYYQNNCRRLFSFVLQNYGHLLEDATSAHIEHFLSCSDDAQRLFARLLSRKAVLRIDAINYAEIKNLRTTLEELESAELITPSPNRPGDQLLNLLRKDELGSLYLGVNPKLRKGEQIEQWLSNHSDTQIAKKIRGKFPWLCIAQPDVWRLAQLLYFGDRQHDWSSFVLKDLGIVEYEKTVVEARFGDVASLHQDLELRLLSDHSYLLDEHPALAPELSDTLQTPLEDRYLDARRTQILLRIARWYERHALNSQAIAIYTMINSHPARERMVRLLHKLGRDSESHRLLETIKRIPLNEEEAQFAERFGKRKAGYQPPTTNLFIDKPRSDIEEQGLELLLHDAPTDKAWGVHVENLLLPSLVGVLYWQAIFADIKGAFTNPFQTGPNDLYEKDFAKVRHEQIQKIEQATATDDALYKHLCHQAAQKYGIANSLVSWTLFENIPLTDFLTAMPMADVRKICAFLIRNLSHQRAGMPDLFIAYGEGKYELVEVKGPSDQLQPGQRVWLKILARMNIPARVLKLKVGK